MPQAPVREQWMDDARCAQNDPEWWFPDDNEHATFAKTVCRTCPVKAQCLEFALVNRIKDGVWGGLAPRDRRGMRSTAA